MERERARHWTHQNVDSWWTPSSAEAEGNNNKESVGTVCRCLSPSLFLLNDSYKNGRRKGVGARLLLFMLRSRSTHLLCVRWGRGLPDLDNSALIDIRVHCFDGICVSFRYPHTHTHTHRRTRTLAISLNTLTPNALFRYVYIYLFTYTFVLLFLVSSYVFTKINGMESSLGQATRQTQSWKWSKLVLLDFYLAKDFLLKYFWYIFSAPKCVIAR